MTASESTVDDLMYIVFKQLLELPFDVTPTRAKKEGPSSEIFGSFLHLNNPLARLSRTETKGMVFSALGELLWYLAGSDQLDFIEYYIKEYACDSVNGVLYGAYGPRLINSNSQYNQIDNVTTLLKANPASRRAVIQLFESRDIAGEKKKEIPCTCSLQFVIRNNRLHLMANMRSNDAFKGLPHDIFAFTMLQEIFARALGIEIGDYYHSVGSLHLYQAQERQAREYVSEGLQPTRLFMPVMPPGDPWPSIRILLEIEEIIRNDQPVDIGKFNLQPYWLDLVRLLQIFRHYKNHEWEKIAEVQLLLSTTLYDTYIARKNPSAQP